MIEIVHYRTLFRFGSSAAKNVILSEERSEESPHDDQKQSQVVLQGDASALLQRDMIKSVW